MERVVSPGPKLQWFGLVDGELVALLEPAAARLRSLLPFGAMAELSPCLPLVQRARPHGPCTYCQTP